MKENRYDDEDFFEKYSQFPRSVQGLAAAGEWHELQRLLPPFESKRVLDLGCGFGWHCMYAARQGAAQVVGTDISAKMLRRARERNAHPCIRYEQVAMEDIDYPAGAFDVALSSLALHYVEDLALVFRKIHRCLVPGGTFVFSCEHPVFTAQGTQEWYYDGQGRPLHWPVDRYFEEGKRSAEFLGCQVVKYHRTLTAYVDTLLQTGFALERLVEPRPDPKLLDVPGMRDELRRPMMLLVSCTKR